MGYSEKMITTKNSSLIGFNNRLFAKKLANNPPYQKVSIARGEYE
jgi:hypothetical protein